ncbi:MAG: hypothetical protein ACK51T_11435, partial [bacterium]
MSTQTSAPTTGQPVGAAHNPPAVGRSVVFRIKRCQGPGQASYWQDFKVKLPQNANIISCLQQIALDPVTTDGTRTVPVVWDSG